MNCPTCGKELRALQVETMIGNPECNEWCRDVYCSQECFDEGKVGDEPVAGADWPPPIPELPPQRAEGELLIPASKPAQFGPHTLATACLVAVPFAIFIGMVAMTVSTLVHRQRDAGEQPPARTETG